MQLARLEAEIASRKAAVLSAPSSARMLDDPPVLGELKARRLVELQIREHEKAARVDQELIEDGEAELALSVSGDWVAGWLADSTGIDRAKRMVEEAATMKRGLAARLAEVQAQKDLTPDDLVLSVARSSLLLDRHLICPCRDAKKKAKSIEHSLRLIQGQMVEFIDRLGEDGQAPDSDDEDEPKKDEPRVRSRFLPFHGRFCRPSACRASVFIFNLRRSRRSPIWNRKTRPISSRPCLRYACHPLN